MGTAVVNHCHLAQYVEDQVRLKQYSPNSNSLRTTVTAVAILVVYSQTYHTDLHRLIEWYSLYFALQRISSRDATYKQLYRRLWCRSMWSSD